MKKTIPLLAAALLLSAAPAFADISKKVQKTFSGQILITEGDLPVAGATDAETIKAIKKARVTKLAGSDSDSGAQWDFNFTAFLKKPAKVTSMSVDFYTDDKEKLYVANKRLMNIDPKLTIISGSLSITEDDGLNRGRRYIVKLTGKVKGRDRVFATTKLETK